MATASTQPKVACPKCGRTQPYRSEDALYRCPVCEMTFDREGDDGGDYSDHNPAARMEREEREKERRRGRGPGIDNRIHRHARGYR